MTTAKKTTAKKPTAAEETVQKAVEAGKETFENAVKASTETVQRNIEQSVEMAKKRMEESVQGYDELNAMSRESFDACVAAGEATTKALEGINAELVALSKKTVEENVAAAKSLMAAKSPKEFFEIQSQLMKSSYEQTVAESQKLNDMTTQAMTEIVEPLQASFKKSFEAMGSRFSL